MRRAPLVITCLLAVLVPAVLARADSWRPVDEHWYVLEIDGAKAGWMSVVTEEDGVRYRTVSESELRFGRAATRTEIALRSSFVETLDGEPVEVTFRQRMSRETVESSWRFTPEGVEQRMRQGGRETTRRLSAPEGAWLPPRAAWRFRNERREADAATIEYRTIDPQNGLAPLAVRMDRVGEGEFEAGGRLVPVTVWTTSTPTIREAEEHYTADGFLVFQRIETGLGRLVTRLTTRRDATAPVRGGGPEIMAQTFVRPDRPISNVGRATRARYRLRITTGDLPALPDAGAQQVEDGDTPDVAVIAVDLARSAAADGAPADAAPPLLEPSAMVDADDAIVRRLAARAVRRAGDAPRDRAEAMRRFVHRHISRKGLATAFATASETARTRAGDCSEHAVLLCAMLRADGIPARVATGLVYVDRFAGRQGIFAWHMWTQALVDGAWVDYDATLDRRYHAGHLLISTSTLADGAANADLASLLTLMGRLEIEVLEIGYDRAGAP
ncbi:MAG: transglutaminase-like domain-containing protein [Planctomycetota bacterium]